MDRTASSKKRYDIYEQSCQPIAHRHTPSNTRTTLGGKVAVTPATARPQLALHTTAQHTHHILPLPHTKDIHARNITTDKNQLQVQLQLQLDPFATAKSIPHYFQVFLNQNVGGACVQR